MKYSVDKKEDYVFFTLNESRVDTVVAPDLKTELVLLVNAGYKNIVLDMSEVEFVDSSGLSALLVGNRNCENIKGALILTGLQKNVQRLIDISKLNDILKVIGTQDEARDYLMMLRLEQEINADETNEQEKVDEEEDFS